MSPRASRRSAAAGRRSSPARVLYLSYDGMCDPLGGSQVLPYLMGLARRGHRISLISFEKPERSVQERAQVERDCSAAGIEWHSLRYHKRPPVLSTMFDVRRMRRLAERLHRERSFDVVHCRSYLSALVGLSMKRRFGVRFIFDMRGFWADERLDGGDWSAANPIYRAVYDFFKRRERQFWRDADQLISLTEAGRRAIGAALPGHAPITVIPCCADFEVFEAADPEARDRSRALLGIQTDERVLGYIGSLGGNYMLHEMLDFYRLYRQRYGACRFLFLTHAPAEMIRSAAVAKGVPGPELIVRSASRTEVPVLMSAADAGIAFKQPTFSSLACCPTKLGEMMALELPVVTNGGVGDVEPIVRETGAGVVVSGFDDEAYRAALDELAALRPDMDRWRAAARRWFDLDTGVDRYDEIYRRLRNSAVGSREGVR